MKPKSAFLTLFIAIVIIFPSVSVSQYSAITSELRDAISKTSDSELIRVLIFFKDEKIFTTEEKALMNAMTETERQSFILQALKQFSDLQQANVKAVIKDAEKNGKAKFIRNLWAAYGLRCWTTKDIIDVIGKMPEVREISWDEDIPPEQVLDSPTLGIDDKTTILSSTPEWGVSKIKAPDVWNLGYTGQNVVIAVLDDGCN